MERKNIFQILADRYDVSKEVERIDKLFDGEDVISKGQTTFTIKEFVDRYCFSIWKNRGHCLDADDFLDSIRFDALQRNAQYSVNDYLSYIEAVYNFWALAENKVLSDATIQIYSDYYHLQTIMDEELSHYNQTAYIDEENEQILVIENKPEATAVAEIVSEQLAIPIIRYNHRSLAGDIQRKKDILLRMGSDLEPRRSELEKVDKSLSSDIFYMLNSMNLRHNNCNPAAKGNYKKHVAEMDEDTLEQWYDELYQMMLLAYLELDQAERHMKIEELKRE